MLTTSPALLAAAQSGSAEPYVRVQVSDSDLGVPRLRFLRWYDGDEVDGPAGIAAPADGSIVKTRVNDADELLIQRIAVPAEESAWDAWTVLDDAEPGPGVGLHASGERVLIAYYDGLAVRTRDSTDSGATWAAEASLVFTGGVVAVACAVRADGQAAAVWALSTGAVFSAQRPAAGSWGSPAEWSRDLEEVTGLAMANSLDWAVLVSGEAPDGHAGVWSVRLGSGSDFSLGVWGTLRPVILASPGTGVTYRATAIIQSGPPRILLLESHAAGDQVMISTGALFNPFEDGFWRDPIPFDHDSPHGLAGAASPAAVFLASPHGLWRSPHGSPIEDLTAHVLDARYDANTAGEERLRLTLDASAGLDAAGLQPGGEVAFAPGYVTDGGLEGVPGRTLWVISIRRRRLDGHATIELEAAGTMDRLRRWLAPREMTWAPGERSVAGIAADIARSAGVRLVTDQPSATATALEPAFRVRTGESGATALARLFERTDDLLIARGIEVIVTAADPEAAPVATYGGSLGDSHALLATGLAESSGGVGWARAFGEDAFGQAVDADALAGGAGVQVIVDDALDTDTAAAARAAATLRRTTLARETAWIEAHVHPALEPGDVIEVTDLALDLDAARFRIAVLRYDYRRRPRGTYSMHVTLGEV